MLQSQLDFAAQMVEEAKESGHPFPGYAAAEACLESAWGASGLATRDKDVFGLKEPSWWSGQVDDIKTEEVIKGVRETVDAKWPVFESYSQAFAARLHVLNSMPSIYGPALTSTSGPEFVRLVSAYWVVPGTFPDQTACPVFWFPSGEYQFDDTKIRWSTAPNRATQVLATYQSHVDVFGA